MAGRARAIEEQVSGRDDRLSRAQRVFGGNRLRRRRHARETEEERKGEILKPH